MTQLANMQLITKEISVVNNNLPEGEFNLAPSFSVTTGIVDETHSYTELCIEIISTEENPFPINTKVDLIGIFEMSNIKAEHTEDFLNLQAVQILFPYARSMISSVTASALMPPIVIPIVDVRALYEQSHKSKTEER